MEPCVFIWVIDTAFADLWLVLTEGVTKIQCEHPNGVHLQESAVCIRVKVYRSELWGGGVCRPDETLRSFLVVAA